MNKFLFPFLIMLSFAFGKSIAQSSISQAPEGFDQLHPEVPKGKIDKLTYFSSTVGNDRKAIIYTPPGYSEFKKYPVLYLLLGIGGDEKEWLNNGQSQVKLDNLV